MRLDEPGAKVTDAPLDLYPHNVSTVIIIIKRRIAIGHVNEYPTMHYFVNLRHTDSIDDFD